MLDWSGGEGVVELCMPYWYGALRLDEKCMLVWYGALGLDEKCMLIIHCLEISALLPTGSPASLALIFLGLPSGLLWPAKWSSFYRRLNRLDTTGPPHILVISRCN
nr:hypothetical protein CFP56_23347 [Quercus suber]